MLLIITEKADLTCDYLILKLIEREIPYLRLNTEDYGTLFELNVEFSNEAESIQLNYNGKNIDSKDITAAYFRRPALPNIEGIVSSSEIEFAQREIETLLSGYFRIIDNEKWLNHPKNIFCSENKIEQLHIAKKLGFIIPDTLISKNTNDIIKFINSQESVIAKSIKNGFYSYDDNVYLAFTQILDSSFIENINQYSNIPMIFQNKIDKEYDIRINVIGDNVFATAILSQEYELSQIDWRVWDVCEKFDLKHKPIDLPIEVKRNCIALNNYFRLNFSAIDMVLDKEGNYIFLELNPNGQWAWIEEKAGYPLRDTFIDFFTKEKK